MSIEASTYVNNALILISGNPYLYDQSFPVLKMLDRSWSASTRRPWLRSRTEPTI